MNSNKSLLKDTATLSGHFEGWVSDPISCENAHKVLLFCEWIPGDEEYLDLMPVFSGDNPDGQFYRVAAQDPIGQPPEDGAGHYVTLDMETFDEPVDGSASSEGQPHFTVVRFEPRGRYFKVLARVRRKIETEEVLSPGSLKVYYGFDR